MHIHLLTAPSGIPERLPQACDLGQVLLAVTLSLLKLTLSLLQHSRCT
jgi:hypothetical protein